MTLEYDCKLKLYYYDAITFDIVANNINSNSNVSIELVNNTESYVKQKF